MKRTKKNEQTLKKCDICGKEYPTVDGRSDVRTVFSTNLGYFCTDWGSPNNGGCWPIAIARENARVAAKREIPAKCRICGRDGKLGEFEGFADRGGPETCKPTCSIHELTNMFLFARTYEFGDELKLIKVSGEGKGMLGKKTLTVMYRGPFGHIVEHPERPIIFTSAGWSDWSIQFDPISLDQWQIGETTWKITPTGKKHRDFKQGVHPSRPNVGFRRWMLWEGPLATSFQVHQTKEQALKESNHSERKIGLLGFVVTDQSGAGLSVPVHSRLT